jgi:signal transduction histidine kinase/DNA-binding response OmpR family regulator
MEPTARVSRERVSILVVDDRPSKLLAMEALLADLGENVVCVSSGVDALRQLLERDFAVVLLDVNMPEMDGFETAALIRQRPRSQHVPIIFMTAGSDEAHALQGYSLGAVDYILTPIVPEVLRTKISVFVELFRMTEQLKQQAEQRVALAEERAARAVAEEASRRTALLAEAGKSMTRSLDLDSTVAAILGLLVPDLADSAALRVSLSEGDMLKVRGGDGSRRDAPLDSAVSESMDRAARRMATQVVPQAGMASGVARGVVCPLLARGTAFGALAVISDGARPPYDPVSVALIEDLCSRAAIAIDNCVLYKEIQQRDVRKDQFLAMLAHELRNPLGAITSALGVVEIVSELKNPAIQAYGVIKRQVQSLTQLVDDLLDVSRVTTGKITLNRAAINLAESVERCVEIFNTTGRAEGHTISLERHDTWVDADSTRLDQVLSNLIGNAIKYTPRGGGISVRVRPEEHDGLVEVEDSGVGMSSEVLSRAFDLFFQADRTPDRARGGLGVGLTLVRELVELHGGRVDAASAGEGRGSRFTVRLPRSARSGTEEARRPSSTPTSGRSTIVVVEDNKDEREMLRILLTLAGHDVHAAADGLSGIEMTEATDPDLVFVDVGLPGADGYEVARRLRGRKARRDVFLVALTGYGQPEDRRKALDAGFDTHIVKPIDPNHLSAIIASFPRCRQEDADRSSA